MNKNDFFKAMALTMSSFCINFLVFTSQLWHRVFLPIVFHSVSRNWCQISPLHQLLSTLHTVNRCFYAFFSSNSSTTPKVPQGHKWESNISRSLWASSGYPVLQHQLHSPSTIKLQELHKNRRTEDSSWCTFLVAKLPRKLKNTMLFIFS